MASDVLVTGKVLLPKVVPPACPLVPGISHDDLAVVKLPSQHK